MNSLMKLFALLAIALAIVAPAQAQTDPAIIVNCLYPNLTLFETNDPSSTPLQVFDTDFYVTNYEWLTEHDFSTGNAWFNISVPYSTYYNTTISISVNGGATTSFLFPVDLGLFPITGLTPIGNRCSVTNIVFLTVSQFGPNVEFRVNNCTYSNFYNFTTYKTSACGDPQFVGLLGQTFQIHGIDGAVYNLISTSSFSMNSQFVFLTGPRPCPVMPTTGKKSGACWSHDGSYLSNLAIVSATDKFIAVSGEASTGFSSITLNDRVLSVGDIVTFSEGSISVNSTHEITVNAGVFTIEVENIDGFVNIRRARVAREDWSALSAGQGIHGLLGQTWQNKRYSGKVPEIEGSPDDYVISNDDIFGTDFPYSRMA